MPRRVAERVRIMFILLIISAVIIAFFVHFTSPYGEKAYIIQPVISISIVLILIIAFWQCGWKFGLIMIPILFVSSSIMKPIAQIVWNILLKRKV
jgi:hypothetical protein